MTTQEYEICLTEQFQDALATRIPTDRRGLVEKVVRLLRLPVPPGGVNYERVHSSPELRSARLDDHYRIIVWERGGQRVLLYVDSHDDAYRWASKHTPKINAYGELQVVPSEESVSIPELPIGSSEEKDIQRYPFADVSEADLMKLGVTSPKWAEHLRKLPASSVDATLLMMVEEGHITVQALERLDSLAQGTSLRKLLPPAQLRLDIDPILISVRKQSIWRPRDWDELARVLDNPWEKWLIFLSPSQGEVVEREYSGAARVTGGPGTGKSVVAVHRAAHLLLRYPNKKIFLATFTRSLINELKRRMALLIGDTSDIVIQHLDEFVLQQCKRYLPGVRVEYNTEELRRLSRVGQLCASATSPLPESFVWQEWEQVIDAWNIRNPDEYLQFHRLGRGSALNPDQRRVLWQFFEQIRTNLRNAGIMTPNQVCYALASRCQSNPPFRCVIADEAQDFGPAQMRLIQSLAPPDQPDNLFFCVDSAQRIYARSAPWVRYNIDIRGRSTRLRINYRNTLEIQQAAEAVLPVTLQIEQAKSLDDPEVVRESLETGWRAVPCLRNPDHPPQLQPCSNREEESKRLVEWIRNCYNDGIPYNQIAIVGRTSDVIGEVAQPALLKLSLTPCQISEGNPAGKYQVYVGSAHAMKGLEFRAVAIVGSDLFPMDSASPKDPVERTGFLQCERNLFYTAMTRPRERLYISWTGRKSHFLP